MADYQLFFGDSHTNLHSPRMREPGYLDAVVRQARELVDFWPIAYYPQEYHEVKGFRLEDWLPEDTVAEDWRVICDLAARENRPGEFVVFSGYEWQGDGTCGDHNVFHFDDHQPLLRCSTSDELYAELRRLGLRAIAIPHHTAYLTGVRGKNWDIHDEELSPFAEIYSVHGCSESDEEWIGLRQNAHMGPGLSGCTIEDGLARGYRLGIICSGDNHIWPAMYGNGLMGCWAQALTRESLWEAFRERRVYGVTSDRIELRFAVEDAAMGSVIRKRGPVRAEVRVRGSDAVDRVELLRNNRVIACYCHNGRWDVPTSDERIRVKLRVEAGWGPRDSEMPEHVTRQWDCSIEVPEGAILSVEKCWRTPGQHVDAPGSRRCGFGFTSQLGAGQQGAFGFRTALSQGEATVFEIEARPCDTVNLDLDGQRLSLTLALAMRGSQVVFFPDEVREYLRGRHGLDAADLPRPDSLYFLSHKAKVHRAIPQVGYTAEFSHTDEAPPEGMNHYRVRAYQRNGAVAWSSPVWVEAG